MDRTAAGRADIDATGHEQTQVVIVGFGIRSPRRGQDPREVQDAVRPHLRHHRAPLPEPLLYQVATGVLSAGEVAPPIRTILQKYPNADVRLGRVVEVNAEENTVVYEASGTPPTTLGYRSLIAATGATQAYFGHDEFEKVTYKLKDRRGCRGPA